MIVFSLFSSKEKNRFHRKILDENETGAKDICFVDIDNDNDIDISDLD
tara:strand:+ start:1475 stop:1618 length:144 start_codon:yes stop_codon:yes gene_type:complete